MSQKVEVFCDRCGSEISRYYDIKNSSAKIQFWGVGAYRAGGGQRIDLCEDCCAEFITFFRRSKTMTDKEIIKALECCSDTSVRHCEKCPLDNGIGFMCICKLSEFALDLIKRQQAEKMKNENIIRLADITVAKQEAEIEKLQDEIKRRPSFSVTLNDRDMKE